MIQPGHWAQSFHSMFLEIHNCVNRPPLYYSHCWSAFLRWATTQNKFHILTCVIITGQIRPDESVFTYPEGNTALDFAFPDHIPQFLDEVVATASVNVLTACGDSVQCIFDASQTGNISIGLETMIINVANVDYRQEASTLMRIL